MTAADIKDVLDAGSYTHTTKPILKTSPPLKRNKQVWSNFRRVILITRQDRVVTELGFGQDHDGDASAEGYQLDAKSYSAADLDNLIADVRLIFYAATQGAVYEHYTVGNIDFSDNPAEYFCTIPLAASRMGQVL